MMRVLRASGGPILPVVLTVLAVAQTAQPPQINFIDFPLTLQADSKPVAGLVGFTDPDGNVNEIAFNERLAEWQAIVRRQRQLQAQWDKKFDEARKIFKADGEILKSLCEEFGFEPSEYPSEEEFKKFYGKFNLTEGPRPEEPPPKPLPDVDEPPPDFPQGD
ncbi:hypothetical protein HYR54_04050 [Candidatus Acetothermia bacterium]|nr:hypothetical protein [Candidatus Acetothermia bacterium]